MEAINVALRQPLRSRCSVNGGASSKDVRATSTLSMPCRRRQSVRILTAGFCDRGHLEYYEPSSLSARRMRVIGGRSEKLERDNTDKKSRKKQMKLLKGISKDLQSLSRTGSSGSGIDIVRQAESEKISEAAELLLEQLQKLRDNEECLEGRTRSKAVEMQCDDSSSSSSSESSESDCDEAMEMASPDLVQFQEMCKKKQKKLCSSPGLIIPEIVADVASKGCADSESSSSESSDSEYDEVVDMDRLKLGQRQKNGVLLCEKAPTPITQQVALFQTNVSEPKPLALLPSTPVLDREIGSSINGTSLHGKAGNEEESGQGVGNCLKKVEVCMGGKCKKSGAGALLEEFQRVLGIQGTVSGCKCMGKCKDGPNVKVDSKSLCVGVGMEDVGVIVANFLGKDEDQAGLAAAS